MNPAPGKGDGNSFRCERLAAEFWASRGISLICRMRDEDEARVPRQSLLNAHAGFAQSRTPAFCRHPLTSKDTAD